jgi:hypothetical protein
VKSLFGRKKRLHSDARTRELNQKYGIPECRLVERDGVIQSVKDYSSAKDERNDPVMNKIKAEKKRNHYTIADNFHLNAKFINFKEDDDDAENDDTYLYSMDTRHK